MDLGFAEASGKLRPSYLPRLDFPPATAASGAAFAAGFLSSCARTSVEATQQTKSKSAAVKCLRFILVSPMAEIVNLGGVNNLRYIYSRQ